MGKTFQNVDGSIIQIDNYNRVDIDEDITTGKISRYYITDGEYREQVLKKHMKQLRIISKACDFDSSA